MKKKMLAAAIASALAVPSAFAAIDDAGMKYTSASEGLYGSLRFALSSGEDDDASVGHESSRIGMQGDVDVGHGNTAFYRAEWRVTYDAPNSQPFQTRLAYIGMKGAYGSVRFGQIWSADYDYVFSLADVTNNVTGNFAPNFRVKNALRYDSPDIQGFNFSIQLHADDGEIEERDETGGTAVTPDYDFDETSVLGADVTDFAGYNNRSDAEQEAYRNALGINENAAGDAFETRVVPARAADADDGNEFDRYILAAGYSIRGVNLGATYLNNQASDGADAGENEDETTWGIGGTYGQDNWKVGYTYGDTSDLGGASGTDRTWHAFAGQVSFDKVTLRAVYETRETEPDGSRFDNPFVSASSFDQDIFTLEAQYSFSSKARAYVNYQNNDLEGDSSSGDAAVDADTFYIAYRVDF